jgi:pheromone receptor transcription factor
MADIPPVGEENPSPATHEDLQQTAAAGNGAADNHIPKRNRMPAEDDEDDDDKPGRERRKIEIKFIQDKSRRHITFSKRKAGIMKKVRRASSPPRVLFLFASPYPISRRVLVLC